MRKKARTPFAASPWRLSATWRSATLLLATSSLAVACAAAPVTQPLPHPISDNWMQGFPPAPNRIIRNSDPDFFVSPKLDWSACHLRELLPTKEVSRGIGAPVPFKFALDPQIDKLTFQTLDSGKTMTWNEAFRVNHTDGVLILHNGKVVYERYAGCLDKFGKHAAMSVSKSVLGILAESLIVEGVIDENALAGDLIPELKGSAFGKATVREILNMTTALKFSEDYANPDADIWKYGAATTALPKPPGYKGPRSYFEYLQGVKANGEQGEAFDYKTINADAIGWIVSRATGKSLSELLSERIWQKMGAEQDAYYTIDSIGTPFAGGGLSMGLRDLARIGELMLNDGKINGKQLIPKQAIDNIRAGGDIEKFAKAGYTTLPGASYKSFWWIYNNADGAYAARGVHGQTIYVDPTANMVIARFAVYPKAANAANDPTSLPAYQAVADYLMQQDQ